VFGFILYGLLQPLGTIADQRFILAAALFGSLIAILEFLTGGVPLGLAALIALIALGCTPDWLRLRNRVVVGAAAFAAAIIACFAYKLLAVAAVFGTNEISIFFGTLGERMGGSVEVNLSESVKAALTAYHINPTWLDANILTRAAFAGLMLTYSSFFWDGVRTCSARPSCCCRRRCSSHWAVFHTATEASQSERASASGWH
jgi:hypothetical protein